MKKIFALLLALALTLTLAACGNTEGPAEDEPPVQEEVDQPEDEAAGEESPAAPEDSSDGTETPAEDPAEETPAGEESSASDSGTGSAGSTGGSKPAGGQNTSGQKPAEEQKPVQEPQEPAQTETPSQPAQPETPEESATGNVDLAAFAVELTGDQNAWPAMMPMEGEALETFYPGLAALSPKQCVVQMAMISASGAEIALVEVADSADVETVKGIFQARIDYQVGDGTSPGGAWYPGPTEMWKSESRIVSNGNFVMLVAYDGADSVVEQFNALFA